MSDVARALELKGEKLESTKSPGWQRALGIADDEKNYIKAIEAYKEATAAYSADQKHKEAGDLWVRIANIQKDKLKDEIDFPQSWQEAAKSYKEGEALLESAKYLEMVVRQYEAQANTRRAASFAQQLAELYGKEEEVPSYIKKWTKDPEQQKEQLKEAKTNAKKWYKTAANWYRRDNATALANKLRLKWADMSAEDGEYYDAIEVYESIAKRSINESNMRFFVTEYLFKAGICQLAAGDMVGMKRALQNYVAIDRTFELTHEFELLCNLTEAVEAGEEQKFRDVRQDYDKRYRLDKWKASLLDQAMNSIVSDDFA